MKLRIGNGIDIHEFSKNEQDNKHLFLGGINIPHERGLKAHSDGDVVLHALVDSILGALSLGDIGCYFPPSDNQWKQAPSYIFVNKAIEELNNHNGSICNIDINILAEEPKVMPYKDAMIKNIAKLCNIEENQVNVKSTTAEKLGFIGRKEGILATATTLIMLK